MTSSGNEKQTMRGLVTNIQRFSIHDGAGIRTLVFLKGCPLRCLWCSNPETQTRKRELKVAETLCVGCGRCAEVCPTGAAAEKDRLKAAVTCINCGECAKVCPGGARTLVGSEMTVDEVVDEVVKDMPFYRRSGGGITLTGGEPLVQKDFALAVLKACRKKGVDTAIETCGAVPWENIEAVLPYLDEIMFDIKQIDPQSHAKLTGRDNRLILENAQRIARSGIPLTIRVPVVPGLTDSVENLQGIVDFANELSTVQEIHLLPYHRLGESKYRQLGKAYHLEDLEIPENADVENLASRLNTGRIRIKVGG